MEISNAWKNGRMASTSNSLVYPIHFFLERLPNSLRRSDFSLVILLTHIAKLTNSSTDKQKGFVFSFFLFVGVGGWGRLTHTVVLQMEK